MTGLVQLLTENGVHSLKKLYCKFVLFYPKKREADPLMTRPMTHRIPDTGVEGGTAGKMREF